MLKVLPLAGGKEVPLQAVPLVPSVGICVGCDYQPTLHKGLRLSFIAFGVLQMIEYKNAVKLRLDLIKHYSSPHEVACGLPLLLWTPMHYGSFVVPFTHDLFRIIPSL